MEIEELLNTIQQCAYEVRLTLCNGYLESVYRKALMVEFGLHGLKAKEEVPLSLMYKGYPVGDFRADIVVEDKVIIELKAVSEIVPAHEVQLINYLTATGLDHGFLINYGGERFRIRHKTRQYDKSCRRRSITTSLD